MSGINSIAGSALQAYGQGLQVTSNNIANLNTDNFKVSRVSFQENSGGGVNLSATATQDTVDISLEATNLLSNSQDFKANLKVLKASDDMTKRLLNIIA